MALINTIKRLELISRTEHVDPSGGEIKRVFYVEPYSAAKHVAAVLLGDVISSEGEKRLNRRILPVNDRARSFFFANEVYIDPLSNEQFSMADSIGLQPAVDAIDDFVYEAIANYDETQLFANEYGDHPTNIPSSPGAVVTAIFRPAISLHTPTNWDDENDVSRIFDWLDPQFTFNIELHSFTKGVFLNIPTFLAVGEEPNLNWWLPWNWPRALFKTFPAEPRVRADDTGVAFKIPDTVTGFTVRRSMVPRIPWRTLSALSYTVNKHQFCLPNGLKFNEGTVRFDGVKISTRYLMRQKICYDMEYHFSIRSTWGFYTLWDGETTGSFEQRYGIVPWGWGLAYPDTYIPSSLKKWRFGWYEITFDPHRSARFPGGHDITKMYRVDEEAGKMAGIGENCRLDTTLFDLAAE